MSDAVAAVVEGAAVGATIGGAALVGGGAYIGTSKLIEGTPVGEGAIGDWIYDVVHPGDPNSCSMADGERGWGNKGGADPYWDYHPETLKDIEKNHSDPERRKAAKKIRKMKEKKRKKPTN